MTACHTMGKFPRFAGLFACSPSDIIANGNISANRPPKITFIIIFSMKVNSPVWGMCRQQKASEFRANLFCTCLKVKKDIYVNMTRRFWIITRIYIICSAMGCEWTQRGDEPIKLRPASVSCSPFRHDPTKEKKYFSFISAEALFHERQQQI